MAKSKSTMELVDPKVRMYLAAAQCLEELAALFSDGRELLAREKAKQEARDRAEMKGYGARPR